VVHKSNCKILDRAHASCDKLKEAAIPSPLSEKYVNFYREEQFAYRKVFFSANKLNEMSPIVSRNSKEQKYGIEPDHDL